MGQCNHRTKALYIHFYPSLWKFLPWSPLITRKTAPWVIPDEPTSHKGVVTFGVAVNDFSLGGHRFDSTDTTTRWCPSLLARYFFNNSNNYIYIYLYCTYIHIYANYSRGTANQLEGMTLELSRDFSSFAGSKLFEPVKESFDL